MFAFAYAHPMTIAGHAAPHLHAEDCGWLLAMTAVAIVWLAREWWVDRKAGK